MPKPSLRDDARAVRRGIQPADREERSARIREHALALPDVARARVVGCYVSVRSEVETRTLLRALLAKGVIVGVPVTRGDELRFARLDHPWALEPGAHGVPEPREPRTAVSGDDIDVLLIPGLRFGRDGSRLGNGGGHFDRFLAAHPKARRVGLAFREQVVDTVHVEGHDESLDYVVTEDGATRMGRPSKD